MDLDTDDEVLRTLAGGHSMDYEQWPGLLSRLIPRLEKIVHNDFPILSLSQPSISSYQPLPSSPPESTAAETSSQNSSSSTESTNKENAPPPTVEIPPDTLTPQIQSLLTSIITTLKTLFHTNPPHTIQRLAELILQPKQHYRSLPSYLHAVDRVVHVTSGAHVFPLPPAIPDPSSAAVLSNGTSTIDPLSVSWGNPATGLAAAGLGSDESLGGALLTPITWLSKNGNGTHSPLEGEVTTESTEMIDGPNGLGGVETVSVSVNGISSARAGSSISPAPDANGGTTSLRAEGGVTQGELLRQEQRAGVVPATQLSNHRGSVDGMGEEDEMPHVRGPEEIGMEDMGPQAAGSGTERGGPGMGMQGIDVEAAVGRKITSEGSDKGKEEELAGSVTPKREAEEEMGGEEKRIKDDVKDADDKVEDDMNVGEEEEHKGANAVDSSAV